MRRRMLRISLLATALLLTGPPVLAQENGGTSPLRFESGLSAPTPLRIAQQGKALTLRGGQGTVPVGAFPLAIAAQGSGSRLRVGVDADGNRQIGRDEWTTAGPDAPIFIEVRLPEATCPAGRAVLALADLRMSSSDHALHGRYWNAGGFRGEIAGVPVWLIDDNLDGRLTQDGQDAIVIGQGAPGVPLRTIHRIGDQLYRLSVDAAGTQLRWQPAQDVTLAQVRAPQGSRLNVLVIDGDQAAFVVPAEGSLSVPAGEYRLSYGIAGSGASALDVKPGDRAVAVNAQPGGVTTLPYGGEPAVMFPASFERSRFTVQPSFSVVGPGGETYDVKIQQAQPPMVAQLADGRAVDTGAMEFG